MNILSVLEEPVLQSILDRLAQGSCNAKQIALELHMQEAEALRQLQALEACGAVTCAAEAYSLCSDAFSQAAQQLLRYAILPESSEASDAMENKSLCEHLFAQREENFEHASFDREVAFYESICSGNLESVKMLSTPLCSKGYGSLSKDQLRNLKYHFTISVAMITRFCINGGMPPEAAYNLSDVFIQKADACDSQEAVHAMHAEMIAAFTKRMRHLKSSKVYSKPIVQTMDYISEHLHQRIMIQEIADHLSLSISYLSRLFKLETGMILSDYINSKKIEAATNMLQYSEYSDLEISTLLCFSSQSYFIKVFKKFMGMTPKEYKKRYRFPDWKRKG